MSSSSNSGSQDEFMQPVNHHNGATPGEQGPDDPHAADDNELLIEFGAELEHPLDIECMLRIVTRICVDHGISRGHLSFTVIGDERIQMLNRDSLGHDYPTDVISFDYVEPDQRGSRVEGEIIVNAEYAAREAPEHGHTPGAELLLYCIHGTLHVLGYDDDEPEAGAAMAEMQQRYLREAHPEA